MHLVQLLGLILTFTGGVVIAVPQVSYLRKLSHRVPPLSKMQEAEQTLYREDEIEVDQEGFQYIERALMKGTQPYLSSSDDGVFRDFSANFSSPDGQVKVGFEDCRVYRIEKQGDDFPGNSTYSIWLFPEEKREELASIPQIDAEEAVLRTEIPDGRLPEIVREYKRSIFARAGLCLLSIGTIIGAISYLA